MNDNVDNYPILTLSVTDDYVESFLRADRTFLYQLVFDPLSRKLVPLTPVPEELSNEDLIYAGMLMADEDAFQLALGNLDCNTMKVKIKLTVSTENYVGERLIVDHDKRSVVICAWNAVGSADFYASAIEIGDVTTCPVASH